MSFPHIVMHVGSRKLNVIKHVMKYRQSATLLML